MIERFVQNPREARYDDAFRACALQRFNARRTGGAAGENIIHQENMAPFDRIRPAHCNCIGQSSRPRFRTHPAETRGALCPHKTVDHQEAVS